MKRDVVSGNETIFCFPVRQEEEEEEEGGGVMEVEVRAVGREGSGRSLSITVTFGPSDSKTSTAPGVG